MHVVGWALVAGCGTGRSPPAIARGLCPQLRGSVDKRGNVTRHGQLGPSLFG